MKKITSALILGLFIAAPASFAKSSAKNPDSEKLSAKSSKHAGLTLASVRSVVKEKMPEVQRCHTDLQIENMAPSGKITFTWDINDQGAVQNINVKEPREDQQALSGCITEKIGAWTFPAAEEGKTFPVTYTFNF